MEKTSIIKVENANDFNPTHILECGQIFRYTKTNQGYRVISLDKKAEIYKDKTGYIIECKEKDIEYFRNFFDLNTDYSKIKNHLKNYPLLDSAINFGNGIRILKQNPFEVIISFIISANNRIVRIQKSIEYICSNLGEKKTDFFAFPTLATLSKQDEKFFLQAGLGYRAKQMVKALQQLKTLDLVELEKLETNRLREKLISISGIGPKVADCILLFGYGRQDVFPVDTWIDKVYKENLKGKETNRKKIAFDLVKIFGLYSGYAQQYLFYWKRSLKNETNK